MQDRIPTPGQEGRVLITPEDGSAPFYATIEMADNPTQNGTSLIKENLLKDQTEIELFGNANNRTVDQAFSGIAGKINLIMGDMAEITLTVQDSSGAGIPGVLVDGMFGSDGSQVLTNASGVATGYVSEGTQTLSISGYADIEDNSMQLEVVKGSVYTETMLVTTRNFLQVSSTRSLKFSENVEQVDVSVVGGGGGGGGARMVVPYGVSSVAYYGAGGGGGGGGVTIQEDVDFITNQLYQAIIGTGGSGGRGRRPSTGTSNPTAGSGGGQSSFLGVTASGGSGGGVASSSASGQGGSAGSGGGRGGNGASRSANGTNGRSGSSSVYASFTTTQSCSGGGGGGEYWDDYYTGSNIRRSAGSGGLGGGGAGGTYSVGSNGSSPGAGGGGGAAYGRNDDSAGLEDLSYGGGKGAAGVIAIRMHLKGAA